MVFGTVLSDGNCKLRIHGNPLHRNHFLVSYPHQKQRRSPHRQYPGEPGKIIRGKSIRGSLFQHRLGQTADEHLVDALAIHVHHLELE